MANEPLGKLGVKLGLGNGILNRIGKISSRWNNREISSSPFLITLVNSRLLSHESTNIIVRLIYALCRLTLKRCIHGWISSLLTPCSAFVIDVDSCTLCQWGQLERPCWLLSSIPPRFYAMINNTVNRWWTTGRKYIFTPGTGRTFQ